MFGDLDWLLNTSRGLSAIAEFLVWQSWQNYRHLWHVSSWCCMPNLIKILWHLTELITKYKWWLLWKTVYVHTSECVSVCISGGGGGYRQPMKPSSRSLLGFVYFDCVISCNEIINLLQNGKLISRNTGKWQLLPINWGMERLLTALASNSKIQRSSLMQQAQICVTECVCVYV